MVTEYKPDTILNTKNVKCCSHFTHPTTKVRHNQWGYFKKILWSRYFLRLESARSGGGVFLLLCHFLLHVHFSNLIMMSWLYQLQVY